MDDRKLLNNNLIQAVQYGDADLVETLLERNSELFPDGVNTCDEAQCSLLHWAAINNRLRIAKYLMEKNVDVNKVGGENKEIPLQWAVRKPNNLRMVYLLIKHGSNMNHKSTYGLDSLHLACQVGNVNITFILLAMGANCNSTNEIGDTCLYSLLRESRTAPNSIKLIRLLLNFHASVSHQNHKLDTAMHIIANPKHGDRINYYVALLIYNHCHSIILSKENADGYTPDQLATKSSDTSFNRFLYDMQLLKHVPKSTPILSTATSIPLFIFFIYYGGIAFGGSTFLTIYLLFFERFSFPNIIYVADTFYCGYVYGTSIAIFWSLYIFILPNLVYKLPFITLAFFFSISIFYSLTQSVRTSPIKVSRGDDEELAKNELVNKMLHAEENAESFTLSQKKSDNNSQEGDGNESNGTVGFRLCTACLIDKSLASMLCMKCDICVQSLDHHCPFINNCVGKGNRRIFVCFTIFASMGCTIYAILAIYVQYSSLNADCPTAVSAFHSTHGTVEILWIQCCILYHNPSFGLITYLSVLNALWIGFLGCEQLQLVAKETSTYEIMKKNNRGKLLIKKGIGNIFKFLVTGRYTIYRPNAKD